MNPRMLRWALGAAAVLLAAAAVSHWRGSLPRTLVASHAVPRTSPEHASATILAPETLPRFFPGVERVEADPAWPALGSTMTWWVGSTGGMKFHARVTENELPARIRMLVVTPSSDSIIAQTFTPDGADGTLYEKSVELHYRGFLNRLMGPFVTWFIASSLPEEVRKAAAAAGSG
jgi:hypothetical protein